MIGIFLIYFIGKEFYSLAFEYHKNCWLFAILGVVMYYIGTVIGGLIIGVLFGIFSPESLQNIPSIVTGLMTLPVGVLACWGFYKILQKNWRNSTSNSNVDDDNVLDSNLMK